jgi:hypothetical protein
VSQATGEGAGVGAFDDRSLFPGKQKREFVFRDPHHFRQLRGSQAVKVLSERSPDPLPALVARFQRGQAQSFRVTVFSIHAENFAINW